MAGFGRIVVGGLVLAMLGGVSGCDVLERLQGPPPLDTPELRKFGMATRTQVADEDRILFEAMVESTTEASWAEALTVLTLQEVLRCDDGGPFSPVSSAPNDSGGYLPADMDRPHPAGTHFRYVYWCNAHYPRTVSFPRDLDPGEYAGRVAGALGEDRIDHQRVLMRAGAYGHRRSKYEAVMSAVGHLLMSARRYCPGGNTLVRDMVLLEEEADPDPPLGPFPPARKFLVGGVVECQATPASP